MIPYDVWAEIDLNAISENIKALKSLLSKSTRLMAVVKADAYGHGAAEVAARAMASGATALGVARLGEAVALRHAGINAPILILGHTSSVSAAKLIAYDLTQTVHSYRTAAELSAIAETLGKPLRIHVKIDTGMGRLGILSDDRVIAPAGACGFSCAADEVRAICNLTALVPEGICTHFAAADAGDKTSAKEQFRIFTELLNRLAADGIRFPVRHAANTAAIIDMPETGLDLVRAGIGIYGHYPSEAVSRRVRLRPAMTVKSRIVHLKTVGPDFKVSYGGTARTAAETTLATVSVGYADGFSRLLSSTGRMTVAGREVPIIGRVCMDQTVIDVGRADVAVGAPVVIFGDPDEGAIPAEAVAKAMGTINYEVLTLVSGRVPRVYRR